MRKFKHIFDIKPSRFLSYRYQTPRHHLQLILIYTIRKLEMTVGNKKCNF